MGSSDSHQLKKFFIRVNSSQNERMQFLLDPIKYIQEALPSFELTPDMEEDIMEIQEKLVEVQGIVAIPPGIKGLVDNLKKGSKLPDLMEDDSVVI
jgi:hypothetical protein